MISQGQYLRQVQRLSPLQIQTIKLLSMPAVELEQAVRKELEENPALDDSNPGLSDSSRELPLDSIDHNDPIPQYNLRSRNYNPDLQDNYERNLSVKESFTQNLTDQLGFKQLTARQSDICTFLIGSLGTDGYLRRDTETILDDLAFHAGIDSSKSEVQQCISIIQELDPPGIGARDLRECLLLQLRAKSQSDEVKAAQLLLSDYYDDFIQRRFARILSCTDMSEDLFRDARKVISKLNPSPGAGIDDSYQDVASQVIPDFVITQDEDGQISYEMPRANIPVLKVSRQYERMSEAASASNEQKQAAEFAKTRVNSAKMFIEAIRQRHITMKKCMDALLKLQRDFLASGDEMDLHPMILEDVAREADLDISTISRVVNSKYIQTSFGIIPMRYLFSEKMSTSEGSEVSAREVKKVLSEIVEAEDKQNPLTDEQLVAALTSKGYRIARRTIAKYREQLGIPLARWRREV